MYPYLFTLYKTYLQYRQGSFFDSSLDLFVHPSEVMKGKIDNTICTHWIMSGHFKTRNRFKSEWNRLLHRLFCYMKCRSQHFRGLRGFSEYLLHMYYAWDFKKFSRFYIKTSISTQKSLRSDLNRLLSLKWPEIFLWVIKIHLSFVMISNS